MKTLALLFLLLASNAFAVLPVYAPQSACVTAASGSSAIPTSYSLANAQSYILPIASGTAVTHFAITTNTLNSAIAISLSSPSSSTVPSNSSPNQILLDASLLPALDGVRIANAVLIRSNTGSNITSGTLCILVW